MESKSEPPMAAATAAIAAAADTKKQLHIAMFPWLAFGHMIPFLGLSKLIAQKGHRITYISTPRNIDRLPKLPPNLSPLITFVKLPLPKLENLPENVEATIDLPSEEAKYLKIAYDGLKKPLTQLLETSSPDWLFFDFAPYWLPSIAANLNISTAYLSIYRACALALLGPIDASTITFKDDRTRPEDFAVKPKWVPFETSIGPRLFEIFKIFNDCFIGDDQNVPDMSRIAGSIAGCDLLAVKSCAEFEPEWFQLLEKLHGKPVLPLGFLASVASESVSDGDGAWSEIKEWLEKKKKGSVVYIAFGSELIPSQEELTEIAHGLEQSKLPFFWVLQKHKERLPVGFEERTKGRGRVWKGWVSQSTILSHDSIGGFLTHGGWSSIVDGLQFGRALLFLTFSFDQGLNAKALEEKKMGYTIPRDERDGSFTRDSVSESLKLVIVEEQGRVYRDKAKEMSGVFGDRVKQDQYVDSLVQHLQKNNRQLKKEGI